MSEDTFLNSYEFGSIVDSPERNPDREFGRHGRHSSFTASPSLGYKEDSSRNSSLDFGKVPFGPRSSIPGFVRSFITGDDYIETYDVHSRTEHFRSMLNMLEKQQVTEMLCQAVVSHTDTGEIVRGCISRCATFRRLLVRNIAFQSTTDDVKDLLSQRYGAIEEGTVVYDRQTNKSKGFAFMTFRSVVSACDAIRDSYEGSIQLHNRQLILKFASDRGQEDSVAAGAATSPKFQSVAPPSDRSHPKKLFVYNLSPSTTSESLSRVFGQFGAMEECIVVFDSNTGASKRYAFVTYVSDESAWKCLQEPSKTVDGQMTFTHLASEGPAAVAGKLSSKSSSYRERNSYTPLSEPSTVAPRTPEDHDPNLVMSLLSDLMAWRIHGEEF
jgi:RNA recognition motif-containing protein